MQYLACLFSYIFSSTLLVLQANIKYLMSFPMLEELPLYLVFHTVYEYLYYV